jgi:hypothetical protein
MYTRIDNILRKMRLKQWKSESYLTCMKLLRKLYIYIYFKCSCIFGHKNYSLKRYCKINVFPFKTRRFNCNSENKSRIYSLPFVSGIFHWYKYCKQSKSLCLKTLFSSILSWHYQIKYKNIKGAYLIHCTFGRKTLVKSKQIHIYVFLIGSEHEPVVVRSKWIC